MVTVQRLEGFYWVAKTGGYARAARAFPYPISQAGVHHQVRRLEEELEVRLFERVGRDNMQLTPAAVPLFEHVAKFFEQLPEVVATVRSGRFGGELRVHSSRMLISGMLVDWLKRLSRSRSNIRPVLTELSDEPVALLRAYKIDVAIEHLAVPPEDIEAVEVGSIRGVIIVPKGASKKLKALASMPFVAYGEHVPERATQLAGLKAAGLVPRIAATAETVEGLVALVAAGLGFSVVPVVSGVGVLDPRVQVFEPPKKKVAFPVYALFRKGGAKNPMIEAFLAAKPPVKAR